jgi:hypothetical protein
MSTDGAAFGSSREPETRSSRARKRQSPKGHRRHGRGRCSSIRRGAESGRRSGRGTSVHLRQNRTRRTAAVFDNKQLGCIRRSDASPPSRPVNPARRRKTRYAGAAKGRRRRPGRRGEPVASATGRSHDDLRAEPDPGWGRRTPETLSEPDAKASGEMRTAAPKGVSIRSCSKGRDRGGTRERPRLVRVRNGSQRRFPLPPGRAEHDGASPEPATAVAKKGVGEEGLDAGPSRASRKGQRLVERRRASGDRTRGLDRTSPR